VVRSHAEIFAPEVPITNSEEEWSAYEAACAEAAQAGKLVVKHGQLITPLSLQTEEGRDLDRMLAAGLLELVDQFEMEISITADGAVKSALADGRPIEKRMEGYTIRVTRADLYRNATYLDLEYVFDTEQDMTNLAKSRASWLCKENGRDVLLGWVGCYVASLEETESRLKAAKNGSQYEDPFFVINGFQCSTLDTYQREDGKWVVPMHQEMTPLLSDIRMITLLPSGFEWISDTEAKEIFYWEDAMTLTFAP